MRRASSGDDSAWANTSATKSISFSTWMVNMDQLASSFSMIVPRQPLWRLSGATIGTRFWRPCASSGGFGMAAEIGGGNGFVAPQFIGLAAEHDASGLQNVAVIGDRKTHARILLDQQDRRVAADLRDDAEHGLNDDRGQ